MSRTYGSLLSAAYLSLPFRSPTPTSHFPLSLSLSLKKRNLPPGEGWQQDRRHLVGGWCGIGREIKEKQNLFGWVLSLLVSYNFN